METAVMSWEDRVPLGSQINVSLGGKADVSDIPARQRGIGAMGTGLAVPVPDELISPDNRAVAHLEGSKSPPRPRTAAGPWLNVSQKAGAFKLQVADAASVDGGVNRGGGTVSRPPASRPKALSTNEPKTPPQDTERKRDRLIENLVIGDAISWRR
jgi:hypothetical protein